MLRFWVTTVSDWCLAGLLDLKFPEKVQCRQNESHSLPHTIFLLCGVMEYTIRKERGPGTPPAYECVLNLNTT